jgi:Tol biopolymer transport system component
MGSLGRFAAALAALSLMGVAACTSSAATPEVIYVTPSPAAVTVPATAAGSGPGTATPSAPTAAPATTAPSTAAPTATPAPTPTPHPTLPPPAISMPPLYTHGAYLLWTVSVPGPSDSYTPQAWLIKPDGSGARKVTDGASVGPYSPPPVNLDVSWSHDGSTIHVILWPMCHATIYDQPVSVGPATLKATMTIKDWYFTWSPTDSKIVYWHFSGADQVCEMNSIDGIHDLAIMTASGGSQTTIKANVSYRVTDWLPNGSALIANGDNGGWYRVSPVDGSAVSLGVTAGSLKVSPDGTKIAFMVGSTLYVRALSGGASHSLGAATDYAWRPDGAALAVSAGTLKVVNATTFASTTVYPFATKSPSWSPDGTKIAFVKTSTSSILVATVATLAVTPVGGTSGAKSVSWQP